MSGDSTNWKSVERRSVSYKSNGEVENYHYYALEKSSNENRIFDRCACINWRVKSTADFRDQINSIDFEELTQKMLFVDEAFFDGEAMGLTKTLQDYMLSLDFEGFVGYINKTNAVSVSVK